MGLDGIDLTDEQRRRIEEVHERLAHASHYELLGVARDADKKAIKRAYFALTSEFHSDRFFGRAIAGYRPMLDAIFRRLTDAHDTLTTATARAEYDSTLPPLASTPSAPPLASPSVPPHAQAPSAPPHPPTSSAPPPAISGVHTAPSAAEIEARKQALARRLMGGARKPIVTPSRPFDPKKR